MSMSYFYNASKIIISSITKITNMNLKKKKENYVSRDCLYVLFTFKSYASYIKIQFFLAYIQKFIIVYYPVVQLRSSSNYI